MGASVRPIDLSDADLYESYRDRGLSHEDAVIHVERRRATKPKPRTPRQAGPSEVRAIGAAQGATAGFADEIIGAMQAISDPNVPLNMGSIDSSIAATRQQFNDARSADPLNAIVGNTVGTFANPLSRILGPMTKGVSPGMTGAAYGSVLGGTQAFGEGEGGLANRAKAGGVGAAAGAMLGLVGGYLVGKATRGGRDLRQMWRNLRGDFAKTEQSVVRTLGKSTPPETVQQVQEAAHRAYLQKQGFSPQVIDRLMETWRGGGLPKNPPPPAPPAPSVTRPGETISQVAPKGFEVTGVRPTPEPPSTPTILEIQTGQQLYPRSMPDIGTGKTLPYYPRGGKVEQAFGPPPMSSPRVPTQAGSFEHIINALRNTPANELPDALSALRALNVPLGGTDEQLIALLTQGRL